MWAALADKALDFLKLCPRYFFPVAIAGFALLLIPEAWAKSAHIDALRASNSGVTFIVCFILMVICLWEFCRKVWGWGLSVREQRKELANIPLALDSLQSKERFYLAYCLTRGTTTLHLSLTDPDAKSLCAKCLLYETGGQGSMTNWVYIIPPHVWSYITSHRNEVATDVFIKEAEEQFAYVDGQQNPSGYGRGKPKRRVTSGSV